MQVRRIGLVGIVTLGLLSGSLVGSPTTASTFDRPRVGTSAAAGAAAAGPLTVGTLTLQPCKVLPRARCGTLARPWDPTGAIPGTLDVGFAFVPARDRSRPVLGTLVPHEGGPGYSTTGSGYGYADMYGPLLERRNLLLVDQRGTGRSRPIGCRALQRGIGTFTDAAAACARQLGDKAILYGTALSADDLAAVIQALQLGPVDFYGDSYGTFFGSVFAGRHGDLLRSIVLDSAYPPTGENAWYPTQGPAMLRALDLSCERTPSCRTAGPTTSVLLQRVVRQVREKPYRGRAADADGRIREIAVDPEALVVVTFGATYGPASYRELPGALRAALAGYTKPLIRLTAESLYGGTNGRPSDYSQGLLAAVACHDYPQLYDMTATPDERRAQLARSIASQRALRPKLYAPFTIDEYLDSGWQMADWCLDWPVAPAAHPAGPPEPPSGQYPEVPTLVLSGEMDSITTAEEGSQVAARYPGARHVQVANSYHVTALGDTDVCAVRIVRRFVARPRNGLTASRIACADEVPPLRAVADYRRSFRDLAPALQGNSGVGRRALRAVRGAVGTAADLQDRWFNNYTGRGKGLHGGRWSYRGGADVIFRLTRVRQHADLAVSGRVIWSRYGHLMLAEVKVRQMDRSGAVVRGSSANGRIEAIWDTREPGALAFVDGRLGDRRVEALLRAP